MPDFIIGVVKNGVVISDTPLPEGAQVQIQLHGEIPEVPLELREELAAWQQASANALALVERIAEENSTVNSQMLWWTQ